MSSALIVRPSSLGDIVHAMPVVRDIRQHRPGISIDWVAEEMFVELVAMNRGVRNIIPVSLRRWRHVPMARATWREFAAFRRALRSQRYDVVVDLQEQVKGALIAWLARGAVHGPDRASIREPAATLAYGRTHRISKRQHLVDRCRELAGKAFGYSPVGPPQFGLTVPHHEGTPPGLPTEWACVPMVILVHATSRDDKLWPEASWRALITHFTRAGMKVLLPSGNESEAARGARLAQGIAGARVASRHSLTETASLLARADLVCGVDTGLVHLAAALGTPTVAVFVATDPELAGVARAGGHARDVGGIGVSPSPAEVIAAASGIARVAST
ncbi:MAG: lipopolysaccharide heptosyltransferase I [Pseudomonadota bacterium]|nr:lipopolysaccharide heptosyltransferase I [Pseudomonadota bacterium]